MPIKKRLSHRNRKYEKLTDEERSFIMDFKSKGMGCQEIARRLNKNLKTVQSVQNSERKSEYKSLKEAITQYGLNQLLQITSITFMDERKLKKLATKTVKCVMPPNNNTMFAHLIPAQKANSNKRRIIDQIVNNILNNIQKILTAKEMISLFEPNNLSQGDTMGMETSEYSQYSSNMLQNDSEDPNEYVEDNSERVPNTEYQFHNLPGIFRQFEGQSINFLNHRQFEKTIEQSSDCYFDL
ncbi:unnamed protein product (macronuclear) [Paramecium tetraurelia]|uniref:Transposase IS30-like HTH domain-containing protein n=1 Tax=Paramecium tetraurelia TaxID=5888 RepID=A0CXM8_PARTE|nr:uncharacterized protein GSPATT00011177001 [Paramecium tetraurelia]CAK75545.1 unnamed protein product [Paramecium tetraurelia]|eukprot:XP_001442942.1 hypothetical protein (macronuclear) [Paramecium tetraurelia strain d4-2]